MPEGINLFQDTLIKSLKFGFVDNIKYQDGGYSPQILVNNSDEKRYVLTDLQKELSKCAAFQFSVAFDTKNGIAMIKSQLSDLTGIPESTISGYFAMRSTPNAGNVQKIADALSVKKSDIDPRFSPDFLKEETGLNRKDEREIESDLEDMMNSVAAAAFEDGSDLEDIEAFKATIKAAMIQAKKIAKKKYTPKKFRKD